jgi:hypothetical protein
MPPRDTNHHSIDSWLRRNRISPFIVSGNLPQAFTTKTP